MGFVQIAREAGTSLGQQGRVGKELERMGRKGRARLRREAGAVRGRAPHILGRSRQREASAVGFTVQVGQGIGVGEARRIIMRSPSEGVAVNGAIS